MPPDVMSVPALVVQKTPLIYTAIIEGRWLLKHSTPSWRVDDPELGFQRVVREDRARAIAATVLAQGRTFPNSIVLATDKADFGFDRDSCSLELPPKARFLVVDGQHRLYAQRYSSIEATYSCMLHMGLTEVQMAQLFLEINDNQKRVPASLRWDLVRLVRPDDDASAIRAADLVFQLAVDQSSPLYQRIDLTGEQNKITLKQASLAPEIKALVGSTRGGIKGLDFDSQLDLLIRYLAAVRERDPDGWRSGESYLYGNRVLRVLLRLLPACIVAIGKQATVIPVTEFAKLIRKLDLTTLDPIEIKAAQGQAGMKEIQDLVSKQMFSA
jgi:DGQHR domain-containing protein